MITYKIQRVIVLIPYINVVVPVFWILNCRRTAQPVAVQIKSMKAMFSIAFLLFFVEGILASVFGELSMVVDYINYFFMYFTPLCIGLRIIRFQAELFGWK